MKYTVYATAKDGDGCVQSLGTFDNVEDIQIRIRMFSEDTVINIEEDTEDADDTEAPHGTEDIDKSNANNKLLQSFTEYCHEHPEERFWQALRNWSEMAYIFAGKETDADLEDTFYWENKNN
jgi:hypothetical protein